MIELRGSRASARVMIDRIDDTTKAQILTFLESPAFEDSRIVVMPDCHAGKGAVIGLTMTRNRFVIPNVVGVDIGCGMLAVRLRAAEVDLPALDAFIKGQIPSGFATNRSVLPGIDRAFVEEVEAAARAVGADVDRAAKSLGSLGGGNHFIELDRDSDGALWAVVHSGSRNFGLRVAEHFQARARDYCSRLRGERPARDLEYLPEGHPDARGYLDAMRLAQDYARRNRSLVMGRLLDALGEEPLDRADRVIESVHNFIDFEDGIVRKGAIAAREGQSCFIPFNMRDGSAICRGRGNAEYNLSAPHGAGRALSRHEARRRLSVDDFRRSMREAGVYTSTAGAATLDEAPEAYKPAGLVIDAMRDTVIVEAMLKPVYNFKAEGD